MKWGAAAVDKYDKSTSMINRSKKYTDNLYKSILGIVKMLIYPEHSTTQGLLQMRDFISKISAAGFQLITITLQIHMNFIYI